MASPCSVQVISGTQSLSFEKIADRFATPPVANKWARLVSALVNKAITFGRSAPNEGEVAVMASSKEIRFGQSWPGEEEIAADDDVIERCGTAGQPLSAEQVATALIDQGAILAQSGRSEEAIAVYED